MRIPWVHYFSDNFFAISQRRGILILCQTATNGVCDIYSHILRCTTKNIMCAACRIEYRLH